MAKPFGIYKRAIRFLQYRIKSVNAHGLHSPFVYNLAQDLLYDNSPYYAFQKIEDVRLQLKANTQIVERIDFGKNGKVYPQSISEIVRNQSVAKKYGQLLFKLIHQFQPSTVLELGTSLGISTAYLSMPLSKAKVFSFEGDPSLIKIARENLKQLQIENVSLFEGEFEKTLSNFLADCSPKLDFIYLDGNHQLEPSRLYFEKLLPYTHEHTVWVFDDIHWSADMEKFWEEIQIQSIFNVTIDLFQMGLAFPQPRQRKEHFVIRY